VADRKVLIAGAMGVVGRAAVRHFGAMADWKVVALSRRQPDFPTPALFVPLDLCNSSQCQEVLAAHKDITHVVYAALYDQPAVADGWTEADHVRINLQMLTNLLGGIEDNAPNFQHISLLQGGKAYGVHLGPPPDIPSRESDGRTVPPNFYFDQEDLVRRRCQGKPWTWTVLRPPGVCGFAAGSSMNMLLAVGVFAAISRELGLPLRFSGTVGHLKDACDANLVARALAWAANADSARNEIFNVSNGDCFLWEAVFPKVADVFSMPHGTPHSLSLARVMPDKAEVWDRIVQKHGLRPYKLADLIPSWNFADFTFRYRQKPFHSLLSTIKIRQAGFHDCIDTEQMLLGHLRALQENRILPF
jgi:nucleoside-diphosphate-sugar epimerase